MNRPGPFDISLGEICGRRRASTMSLCEEPPERLQVESKDLCCFSPPWYRRGWPYSIILERTWSTSHLCRCCQAVVVEDIPWGDGKSTLTKSLHAIPAPLCPRLYSKETPRRSHLLGLGLRRGGACGHVGLEHWAHGQIDAIGVDEIQ